MNGCGVFTLVLPGAISTGALVLLWMQVADLSFGDAATVFMRMLETVASFSGTSHQI